MLLLDCRLKECKTGTLDTMDVKKIFGESVRKTRRAKGLSQDALAARANLHRTYIGAVERGERNITLINAEKIAKALDVYLIELLKESE